MDTDRGLVISAVMVTRHLSGIDDDHSSTDPWPCRVPSIIYSETKRVDHIL